ncbi:MAG: tRNA (adenosine(37)-N6)-threonylcarbamoyltransferase complex transferase subunit TsaD [Coriobacteriia bacterium]|nr:tRNA (adenosine(37)-N6)-threonylcarbamoyltransferase complex transferase subunit TsaD [Coriobacteriia bacterium]
MTDLQAQSNPRHQHQQPKLPEPRQQSEPRDQRQLRKPQYILALDTATTQVAIAVGVSNTDLFSATHLSPSDISLVVSADFQAARQANVSLLPAIDRLLSQQGIAKAELAAIVCGLGPGSFTGVRIALATAKGLARALHLPLFGVSTLDAVAWQAWANGMSGIVAVVGDAMRNEIYPARYHLDDSGVIRLDYISVSKVDATLKRWQDQQNKLTLIGDGLFKFADQFEPDSLFTLADQKNWLPTGHGLLMAMADSWGEIRHTGNAGAILPIYTRLSDAEENERIRLAEGGQIAQGSLLDVPLSGVVELPESGIHYRPMAAQDTPWVAALEAECFNDSPGSGECWDEAAFRAELNARDRSWWVAWREQELVGYTGGMLIDGDLHILDLAVSERHRRAGIASALLSHLLEDARALGAKTASLEVRASNQAAIALYARFGFETEGLRPGYYSPPTDSAPREDALILRANVAMQNQAENINYGDKTSAILSIESGAAGEGLNLKGFRAYASPVILAIETSCDETAAAVITGDGKVLANTVATQVDYHARFGGVVPEIASRKHTEAIVGVVDQAMEQAGLCDWSELDAVAVTYTPGLIGALVVGVAFAKALAWGADLPLVQVNHMEGHVYANRLYRVEQAESADTSVAGDDSESASLPIPALFEMQDQPSPPFVIALLSGGHTMLVHVQQWGRYHVLGQTLDDAVGEAFDKVAKALGLGYPGGPVISRLAAEGNSEAIAFPRALLHTHDYSFSLSGLKTAVISYIRSQQEAGAEINLPDISASFQQAVIDVQVAKARLACEQTGVKAFGLGGGVAANQALREAYIKELTADGITVYFPPLVLCSDNAAMIAATALDRYARGLFMPLDGDASAQSDLSIDY